MNQQIYKEASEWLVDLRVGDVDAATREKLDAWFRASPEHIRAFLELSNIWEEGGDRDLDRTRSAEDLISLARTAVTNIVRLEPAEASTSAHAELQTQSSTLTPVAASAAKAAPLRALLSRPWWMNLAASVAFVSIAVAALAVYSNRNSTYATGTGQQRTVDLPDGSKVELNARSRIEVRFSQVEREVDLLEGQALFKVAKDAARPFVVKSDTTRVTAVGTQFDVYRKTSGTTVTVIEGRVAVLPPEASTVGSGGTAGRQGSSQPGIRANARPPALAVILVSAGEQVTVTPSKVTPPAHTDVAAATAWTQRELVFDATPLTDVAQEFNRYNEKPLIVSDVALKDFHVTGVFSSTNPASLLKFLRAQKNIKVDETDAAIRITGK